MCRILDGGGKIWFPLPKQPVDLLIPSEPGQLPFGILPGAELDLIYSILDGPPCQEGGGQLLVADGLHSSTLRGNTPAEQILDLMFQPKVHHLLHPPVDAIPKPGPLPEVQRDGERSIAVWDGLAFQVMLSDGLSGGQKNLQRPDDALFIVGMKAGGRLRVDLAQLGQ